MTCNSDEIAAVYEHLQRFIDPAIRQGDTMVDVKHRPKLSAFLKTHVKARHYFFSVKKCGEEDCDVCSAKRLDDPIYHLPDPVPEAGGDHYQSFEVFIYRSQNMLFRE